MRMVAVLLCGAGLIAVSNRGQAQAPADATIVRLKPGAFASLPITVRRELERRSCLVPQSFATPKPHNVITGTFTTRNQVDIAVLCSKNAVSSILVFRKGSTDSIAELARQPDRGYIQDGVGPGGSTGFSRVLDVASPAYIQEHHVRYGGPAPPRLDHDGLEDGFDGKASVVWYWFNNRWLQLQGADLVTRLNGSRSSALR
jgi:hypothetical protein